MQKTVQNICQGAKERKQTSLNIKDTFRGFVGVMMNLLSEDDKFAQVQYKEGIKRHRDKAIEAMLKECCQLGDGDKEAFIPMDA